MKEDRLMRPILDGEYIPSGKWGMINKVSSKYYNYNSAIGYSFLFYLIRMVGAEGVKVLSIDGVKPEKQTIQSNKYPFVQTVYAVTTGGESKNTKKFIQWILSAQGQELVEKTGYIPLR
jgi:phosphate transport system substrate-binding protein